MQPRGSPRGLGIRAPAVGASPLSPVCARPSASGECILSSNTAYEQAQAKTKLLIVEPHDPFEVVEVAQRREVLRIELVERGRLVAGDLLGFQPMFEHHES